MRPTVHDVAQAAGVSLATVDRVLNRRAGVRSETVLRVEAAIGRIGFVRDMTAANLAKKRIYRFVFVLPGGTNSFMHRLEQVLRDTGARLALERVEIEVISVPPFDAAALAQALDGIDASAVSGVAVVATASGSVRQAFARLQEAGIPVVTLVSDAPAFPRSRYVGIDNVAAGRTAASLLGRFWGGRPGKVALIAGSMLLRDHVERRMGFDQVMRAEFPALRLLGILEARDDSHLAREMLKELLDREGDVAGIYSMGAGNRGIIEALEARAPHMRPLVVAHELSTHARSALESGIFHAVINQDVGHEVRSAIRVLRSLVDRSALIDAQEQIRIEIYLRDNLP